MVYIILLQYETMVQQSKVHIEKQIVQEAQFRHRVIVSTRFMNEGSVQHLIDSQHILLQLKPRRILYRGFRQFPSRWR